MLKFNCHNYQTAKEYAELSNIVFQEQEQLGSITMEANRFANKLKKLSEEVGLPIRLRDLNIPQKACTKLAEDAMKQTRLLVNNPRKITEMDALQIYKNCW